MVTTNIVDYMGFTDMFVARALIGREVDRAGVDKYGYPVYIALHLSVRLRLT